MLLGCIADDLTGATDLAGGLVREGLRVDLAVGVPEGPLDRGMDAVVVALKSRSVPARSAVELSLRALDRLRAAGAERIYFKYASTFDSTAAGNIGPVTDALQAALGAGISTACPAFPANGRTVLEGHLWVDGGRLAESHMRHHPLNPMTESDLVLLLGAQATGPVGLVPRETVMQGPSAIRGALDALERRGARHAIVDAVDDADLRSIAAAVCDAALVTGGSALAAAIAAELRGRGAVEAVGASDGDPAAAPAPPGPLAAVVAGSCSAATLRQIDVFAVDHPVLRIDPRRAVADPALPAEAVAWAAARLRDGPVLIAASAEPSAVAAAAALGPDVGATLERVLAEIAAGLVDHGVGRLVVAGGETSGAVIAHLGVRRLRVGPEIEPGVPAVSTSDPVALRLALKSGNFGSDDFFEVALAALGSGTLAPRGPAWPPERGEGS
ncbi:MAG TPA: 3-oxo-tetronate kinase [Candidatus Limnocylindrales bacterium]|nr:3-oxo-tetronate kinase [Candidatus Limnocylindrales bacterium]